jgi:hypothetical protein
MIPTLGETLLALAGLWRFAREGAPALRWFDRSMTGFWRSFGVAIIVAPLQALWIATHTAAPADAAGWFGLISTEASSYVILWIAFPLALYHIVARPGRLSPYVDFVVIYNWLNLPWTAAGLAITLLGTIGLIGDTALQILMTIFYLGILAFEWFVARQTLKLGGLACAGLVALDFAITIVVESVRIEIFAS